MPAWTIPYPAVASAPAFQGTVVALLHFDASHGSTTFTDEVGVSTWVRKNNEIISTTQSKFGGSSLYADGSTYGEGLQSTPSANFDMIDGDFTVEAWVYVSAVGNVRKVFCVDSGSFAWNTGNGTHFLTGVDSSGHPTFTNNNGTGTPTITTESSLTIPTNQMTMLTYSWVYSTQTMYFGVDGTVASQVVSGSIVKPFGTTIAAGIGRGASETSFTGGNTTLTGYIDEVRITKGGANRIATFTPPTSAFTYP